MTGEAGAIGTMLEGGLAAAAVETVRGAGVGADGHSMETACLNCATPLVGDFCHGCGQHAHVHRSLGAFAHDLLHGVMHLEGSLWRTLPMLAWRPGELTRRYIAGERRRFISPMALFLFAIFLMFAALSLVGHPETAAQAQAGEGLAKIDSDIAEARARLARTPVDAAERADLRQDIIELESARRTVETAAAIGAGKETPAIRSKADTDWPWLNRLIDKAAAKATANPSLMLYKLQSNGYKFAWLLIPLSLPFMWLVTLGRGARFYDHTVFVTYSVAFMSLGSIVLMLMMRVGMPGGLIATLGFFGPPIHLYRQMRGAYGCSRTGALLRTALLVASILVIATLFFALLLLLGVTG